MEDIFIHKSIKHMSRKEWHTFVSIPGQHKRSQRPKLTSEQKENASKEWKDHLKRNK